MNDEARLEELTKEQILDLADAQGKKLGFLLATCPLNEGTKEAILGIIEKANFEQINAISKFFEEGYLMAQNQDMNSWLKTELEKIKSDFDKKQEEVDTETTSAIEKLTKSV